MAEWGSGRVPAAPSTDPLVVEALVVEDATRTHELVANLTRAARRVASAGPSAAMASLRLLDGASAGEAATDPAACRGRSTSVAVVAGRLELELDAYAVARVDVGT